MKTSTLAVFVFLYATMNYSQAELFLKGQMDNVLPTFGTGVNGNAITPDGVLNVSKHSFIAPGDILFSAKRRCGDGDVVRFSQANPNFHFYNKKSPRVQQVFGYWLSSDDNPNSIVPSSDNWMPIFYGKINISSGFTLDPNSKIGTMPLHPEATGAVVTNVTKTRLGMLFKQLNRAYHVKAQTKSNTKYRLHLGSMMCADYFANEDQTKDQKVNKVKNMASYDLALSFTNTLVGKVDSLVAPSDFMDKTTLKNKLSTFDFQVNPNAYIVPKSTNASNSPGPLTIKISDKGTKSLLGNPLIKASLNLLENYTWDKLTYPTTLNSPAFTADPAKVKADAIAEYANTFKTGSTYSDLKALRDQIYSQNAECSDLKLSGTNVTINSKLWFYPTVMNLECKMLTDHFVALFDDFFNLNNFAMLPKNQTEFDDKRAQLVHKLYTTALLKEAQVQASLAYSNKETIRCFENNSADYAQTILNGAMIMTTIDSNGNFMLKSPAASIHPEYLYAILPNLQKTYKTNKNYILFGDRDPKTDAYFSLDNIPSYDPVKSFSQPLELKMQVRSLPGGIEIFDNAPYYFKDYETCEYYCDTDLNNKNQNTKEKKSDVLSFNMIK